MKPLISILIRTKDRPALLQEALESIKKQTYRPLEVVIVNDGGVAVESEVTSALLNVPEITYRYHSHPRSLGRSQAANQAMELAGGEYLLFLDDDDLIKPNHIDNLISLINRSDTKKNIGAYSGTQCVTNKSGQLKEVEGTYNDAFSAVTLGYTNYLPIHAVLFNRQVFEKGCRFNTQLDIYEDWNFWLQATRLGDLVHCSEITALYRVDISGVGQPNQNRDSDFTLPWKKFIEASKAHFSYEQLNHLIFAARHLSECQVRLTESTQDKDQLSLTVDMLHKHLADFSDKHNELEGRASALELENSLLKEHLEKLKKLYPDEAQGGKRLQNLLNKTQPLTSDNRRRMTKLRKYGTHPYSKAKNFIKLLRNKLFKN